MKKTLLIGLLIFLNLAPVRAANEEYKINVDDALQINILQPEKLSADVTVAPDGSISFPYIGSVHVKGLTLAEIQSLVQTKLSDGYMKYPLVTTMLKESKSRRFYVYGDVIKPGVYSVEGETTVLKAISMAGGFSANSLSPLVKILRPYEQKKGYKSIEVDIKSVMQGSGEADISIIPGDSVIVSEGRFFVSGDVTRPGVYPMGGNTTVLKAISIAGGFIKSGSYTQVKILRPKDDGTGNETLDVNIKEIMKGSAEADIQLKPEDTVIVSEGSFFVYGDVSKPGIYPLEKNTSVLKAISIAGGLTKNNAYTQVKILRPKDDGTGNETLDINIKEIMMGAGNKDILLKPEDTVIVSEARFFAYGDVAKPGIYPMERDMTVLKAISLAGGTVKSGSYTQVKILRPKGPEEGSQTIEVDLKQIMAGAGDKDMVLKPEDTIIISQGKFYVYGEVTNPGVYAMEEDTSVLKAIAIAGGFTKYGSSSRVKLLRPSTDDSAYETIKVNIKDIMDGYSDADAVLRPNDTVVVFEGII